jgi:ABC-type multidrug transport system ATPase subunit
MRDMVIARMTLLLGPPSSGKTTLLLALAGKLDHSLKVKGGVTYNGHTLKEFVPQKTSAYVSQNDLHVGELTVRETMDFSAHVQGVGSQYGNQLSPLTLRILTLSV